MPFVLSRLASGPLAAALTATALACSTAAPAGDEPAGGGGAPHAGGAAGTANDPGAGGGAPVPGTAGQAGNAGASAGEGGSVDDDPDPAFTPEEKTALAALSPASLPTAPADPTNRFADNADAARFGQTLFFDTFLAGPLTDHDNDGTTDGSLGSVGDTGKVACASCHDPDHDFVDHRSGQLQISLGAGWGRRRAPSLLDVGQARVVMWDGRRDALWNQPFGPIESFVEMNSSRLYAAEQVFRRYRARYEALFGPMPPLDDAGRFAQLTGSSTGCTPSSDTSSLTCDRTTHGVPGDGAEYDHLTPDDRHAVDQVVVDVGKAIAAYERKLTCGQGAFDAWSHGDASALSRSAQRGAAMFVGKGACATCHSGPFLSDQQFHDVGLIAAAVQGGTFVDNGDRGAATGLAAALIDPLNTAGAFSDAPGGDGRLPATVTPAMQGAFRTPTLRCVSRRPTFLHTGQFYSLGQVIDYFIRGGDHGSPIGASELVPLSLSTRERNDLVAFLESLDGPGAAADLRALPP